MDQNKIIERFHDGQCFDAYRLFGAHFTYRNHQKGVLFTVYAPHARNVSVVGNFTNWDENAVKMERMSAAGVWSVFINNAKEWDSYKYRIEDAYGNILYKSDPYAFYSETRPSNASKIYNLSDIHWSDSHWMKERTRCFDKPVSIYEVYAGGWKKNGNYPYTYQMMEENLIPYVKEHGFTHIEMMPLTEYPYDGSWGYQVSGYFSVTSRYGNPTEFASFVNACHKAGIGVIMDMVPVHFVKDEYGLRYFDGQALYEYTDDTNAESQWGTMNFNLWNEEVRSFLMSSASFWCETYHIDGIRIDAVSNLIYWGGNRDRGENEGSLIFIRRMNYYLHKQYPEVMLIAEDSSDYSGVTASSEDGGLGFDYKWDLGWMNDTLNYYASDPLYRGSEHHKITFSMQYFYSERFMLPLSHDENVHGKKTIVDRMWGDYDQKFSQVRNLYAYMFAHPGKKLNFMGNEIASFREFDETKELDWFLLKYPRHDAFQRFFTDLNHLYQKHSCLYKYDYGKDNGFHWINADDDKQSIYSFYRADEKEFLICIMNCRDVSYPSYDIPVPVSGTYKEILNTEDGKYDGCNMINKKPVQSWQKNNSQNMITVCIAPWAALWLVVKR